MFFFVIALVRLRFHALVLRVYGLRFGGLNARLAQL